MQRNRFLGDMLSQLLDRRSVMRGKDDTRDIYELCHALMLAEGEVSGLRIASTILARYAAFDDDQKTAFFHFLNSDLDIDATTIAILATEYAAAPTPELFGNLCSIAESKRQEFLRRLNQPVGATSELVAMRVDLLKRLKEHPDLARTNMDFVHLLRSWFNRGFLVLRQISWETPASILEKIVEYEAVHAINDWDDLRRRLYPPDRRCFAYFHPTMPDEPLIFVEVALTLNVPNSIQHVLADSRELRDTADTKVAVFYSISNCQKGLQGISFGNLLIKQVVDELRQEFSDLETFVTLSPIPRLNTWLATQPDDPMAQSVLNGTASDEDIRDTAATYLLTAKTERGTPFDPVARFHLGNGAQIYAVHADADLSENGLAQSSGAMVNYHYDRFVQDGDVSTAPEFTQSHQRRKSKSQK
jgi:malonyl-CoA decarboxylase